MKSLVVIPARYGARRFPGKPLADLGGAPLIWRVYEAARAAGLGGVLVATDDERIARAVEDLGGRAEMTSADHASGTDRIAEVAHRYPEIELFVNVQGDEPMVRPEMLRALVQPLLDQGPFQISTLALRTCDRESFFDPNVVKVVLDGTGRALYFSRAPVPWPRDLAEGAPLPAFRKHLGLYAYRREALLALASLPPSPLEQREKLEQLRALEAGLGIAVAETDVDTIGVDTPADLDRVARVMGWV